MDFVKLTDTIVRMLVHDEESVTVKEFETDDENLIQIEVMVAKDDLGLVIGKNGRTIQSIRTIVQASSVMHGGKLIKINVDSY